MRDFFYFRFMKYSSKDIIDFASNDYLGFSKNKIVSGEIFENKSIFEEVEKFVTTFHQSESALFFNSVSEANVAFFKTISQKDNLIFFDELCNESILQGIRFSIARTHQFIHNDYEDLERLIQDFSSNALFPLSIYIVSESVFSIDGDTPNLEELIKISQNYNCKLVLDESNALGVFGSKGEGITQMLGIQDQCFARIINFENALACSGATIVGSKIMTANFIEFNRKTIFSIAPILTAYKHLELEKKSIEQLRENIVHFNQELNVLGLKPLFVRSKSAVQSAIILGNKKAQFIANQIQENGFDVKVILSPEVPEGQERLRFCLHSFNSREEISEVLGLLSSIIFS